MYSAREFNSQLISLAKPSAKALVNQLPATESLISGMGGVLTCRTPDFQLSGRSAWIFISIKNRGFNRKYIDRFIDMCDQNDIPGYICPVDEPYRYNAMAELQCDDLPDHEMDKIMRLSSDISRMAQKAINGKRSTRVKMVKWRELEEDTPPIYRQELTQAFKSHGRIRDILYDHVSSVKHIESERDFERFAEFFLCEVPVLMHTYYSRGATLDIYPGPQPRFFWQIELGVFEDELPQLTAMTRRARPMLYLDTHDRSRKKAQVKA